MREKAINTELSEKLICDFDLKLEGSRLEPLVQRLHQEMTSAGLSFKPKVYVAEEWGCPEGVPLIGVPFYLFDDRLFHIEEEFGLVEGSSDEDILRYLRHEAGHAFNYAYRIYEHESFHEMFGPYSRPYLDDYKPNPFSTDFVRYLPGWYAQKHPDEDFAETFAVWLDPASDWRRRYEGWGCYPKLLYIDEQVKTFGHTEPLVACAVDDPLDELSISIGEHYRKLFREPSAPPAYFDGDLRDIFEPPSGEAPVRPAEEFLAEKKKAIASTVAYWTGADESELRVLIDHFIERCGALGLTAFDEGSEQLMMKVVTVVTALAMNKVHQGNFIGRPVKSAP